MKLPHKFGKYVLLKKIANGGMAEIYKAKYYGERGFAKYVAVKRILPAWTERKDFETMLVDEAKALVHLQHQNIVQVYELGQDDGCFFISMEYVEGVDLKEVYNVSTRRGKKIPEKFVCFIITEVLKALEFAHRRKGDDSEPLNIVHRDVSPANILLSYNGEVKLTDFGIAKGLHRDGETTTNQLKGKYAYMSPEQAMGGQVDLRSDLFSLGIILYELLTGERLFGSSNDFETIRNVQESRMPEGWESKIPLNMRRILLRALALKAEKRYQTAGEFLKDIDDYIGQKGLHINNLELSGYFAGLFEVGKAEVVEKLTEEGPKTKVLNVVPAIEKASGMRWNTFRRYAALFSILSILLFSSVVKSGNRGDSALIESSEKNVEEVKKEAGQKLTEISMVPAMPDVGKGTINVDSIPSGASVMLRRGDVTKNFTTPFVAAGIDVDGGFETRLIVAKEGFKPIDETLSLSRGNPSFTKIYSLESILPATVSVQARPWGYVSIPGVLNKRESPVRGVKLKPGKQIVKVYYSPTNTWAQADLDVQAGSSHRCIADFTRGKSMSCK